MDSVFIDSMCEYLFEANCTRGMKFRQFSQNQFGVRNIDSNLPIFHYKIVIL